MGVIQVGKGDWKFDIRHPSTKKRKRVGGFRTQKLADTARWEQIEKWEAEIIGAAPDAAAAADEVKLSPLLRDELEREAELLRAEWGGGFENLRLKTSANFAEIVASAIPANLAVSELEASHLERIVKTQLAEGNKPSSVNTRQVELRFVLRRIGVRLGMTDWVIPKVRVPGFIAREGRKLRRVWSDAELAAILHVLDNPHTHSKSTHRAQAAAVWRDTADVLRIAALTGMRKMEILLMDWNRIYFPWGLMKARTLKRRGGAEEYRDIPVDGELRAVLESRRKYVAETYGKDERLVFPRNTHYVTNWLYEALHQAASVAGVPYGKKIGMVPHGLRHTAATKMVTDGVDIATAADILGNSVETMLQTYARSTIDSKRNAMRAMSISRDGESSAEQQVPASNVRQIASR